MIDAETAGACLVWLGIMIGGTAAIHAARWLTELHQAGMCRLAIHRARQRCVNLDSWRQHVNSVRGGR